MKILLILLSALLLSCTEDGNSDSLSESVPDLRAWLDTNSNIASAIKLEDVAAQTYFYGGSLSETAYDSWSETDKTALDEAFSRAWANLVLNPSSSAIGTNEFSMPLECTFCVERLQTHPSYPPFTIIPEDLSKRAYISYVAQSLALEISGGLGWSILEESETHLYHYLNSRAMMHRLTGSSTDFFFGYAGSPGTIRGQYIGRGTPATPIYTYWWFRNNQLLGDTKEQTIYNVLEWFRQNAVHYYGSSSYLNMNDHWGYPSQPPANYVISGTILSGESVTKNWTAGCHGTTGFIKSALKAINIPAEVIYTCGHAQLYFPTLDRYLLHGDDPYNNDIKNQPEKNISGLLIDSTTYTSLFGSSPDFIDPSDGRCSNIGYAGDNF